MGANFDIYDISDFKDVADKYKAVIFLSGVKTNYMNEALDLCKKRGVKYISVSDIKKSFCAKELRAFWESAGAHIYCKTDDLVYANDNYIAIHSSSEGEKNIYLDGAHTYRELLCDNAPALTSDRITFNMKNNETKLFEIVEWLYDFIPEFPVNIGEGALRSYRFLLRSYCLPGNPAV